jgi:hypothetical protein
MNSSIKISNSFSTLKYVGTVPDRFNSVKYLGTVPRCFKGVKSEGSIFAFSVCRKKFVVLPIFCIFELLGLVFGLNMENSAVLRRKTRSKVFFVDFTCGNETDMIETSNGEEIGYD